MFLEAGAEEMIVVAAVALIVVGPKDLPVVLKKVGQFTAKMRGLAAEFRASFDEMARQSELDELKREVEALRRGDYVKPVTQEIDSHFESLHRELGAPPPTGFGAREGEVIAGPGAGYDDGQPVMLPLAAPPAGAPAIAEADPDQPLLPMGPLPLVHAPEAVGEPAG